MLPNYSNNALTYLQIYSGDVRFNMTADELVEESIQLQEGTITDRGALSIKTGRFTGRSPKDRYIVDESGTNGNIDWNTINQPITQEHFDFLKLEIQNYLSGKTVYVKDGQACSNDAYKLNVRLIAEKPWSAQFVHNMFLRLNEDQQNTFKADWHILCAPGYQANTNKSGTISSNFSIINFAEQTILIGGTGYTGEIKKGIFSVLNCTLPLERNVLPMHCSANVGSAGDTAIFFGLSGTGKTTLSTDPNRALIGDDEHGWADEGVFNFEGGCYAKCIDLNSEKEPEIFEAIKPGAILENIGFVPETNIPDFSNVDITQNTRVSYPIHHIANRQPNSIGGNPSNVFFLTCDAYGVLPPVSKLTKAQAMYHFVSGYTAKVAGTEDGISEPQATFSACFGAPFLPLHPTQYAEMLGDKLDLHNSNCWLINTGWTGGAFPQGNRISLKYTRSIISAILNGSLEDAQYHNTEVFNLSIPTQLADVPTELLNPKNTWTDKEAFDTKANKLASLFIENFKKYSEQASTEVMAAAPQLLTSVVI